MDNILAFSVHLLTYSQWLGFLKHLSFLFHYGYRFIQYFIWKLLVVVVEMYLTGKDVVVLLNKEGSFKEEPSLLHSEASRLISIGKHCAFIWNSFSIHFISCFIFLNLLKKLNRTEFNLARFLKSMFASSTI